MAGMVGALMAVGAGITFMINSISLTAGKLKALGPALLMVGGAVLLVSAGISLLSYSAIQLAAAGPLAIGVMVGMVAAIAGLAVCAAAIGPALTAGAVGFIAFGAAIALVGAGALMASAGLVLVAGALPAVVQYGASGAVSIAALAGAITLFGLGTLAAVPAVTPNFLRTFLSDSRVTATFFSTDPNVTLICTPSLQARCCCPENSSQGLVCSQGQVFSP